MQLRPHQIKAVDGVKTDYTAGHRQLLLSMATGTGKTVCFGAIHEMIPGKTLILAHTEELVDQAIATMKNLYPTLRVDKEMAQHKADPAQADIIVASVASLGRKGTSRVNKYNWNEWTKIIVDEAHHTVADSYRNILECAGSLLPDTNKLLLGVTATTQRADGKALGEFFKRISYVYGMRQAIDEGWLVDVKGYRVDTETDLTGVAHSGGDFNKNELSDKVNNTDRNDRIVKSWLKLGQNRQTVAFCASVDHAKALAAGFKANGVEAEAVWGDDPDRAQKLVDHKAGKIKTLCNYGVLVEGYDDPSIGCIVIARPTESETLFTQMCGRGTRLQEGTGNLKELLADPKNYTDGFFFPTIKTDCIIIDVVDNSSTHSLMTLPSLMGLPNTLNLKGQSAVGAAKMLEDLQEQHPQIDFSKLKDITEVDSYIEQVNMFEVRFPEEVEQNSDLKWYKTVDGKFRMQIPGPVVSTMGEPIARGKSGQVSIYKNLLDRWEIDGQIKDSAFHGTRATMEEAFVTADHAIRERAGQLLPLLNRKASWHGHPVDKKSGQWRLLNRLYPGKSWPEDLTKGQASFWIDKKLARKGK